MKIKTTYLLTIITIVDLMANTGHPGLSIFLWLAYGAYRLMGASLSD